ncbi:hypothetical protein ElP_59520 [Tautonia plasticadhaerens]|uniref:Uncharacterized protein n=2 Tax=Tautonia plasticadhaerens TaxID=2527974 RepID=A0A518HAW6_9BACT|nr:hypothetical protein ElP_59520 [Tautonia plasticadhaerens]
MAALLVTLGPLACYFAAQGLWLCSPRPRLVSGTVDYLLMAFGLGALLAYGPVGGFLLQAVFRSPGLAAHLAWLSLLTTAALALAGPSHRRLLVYNIDPARAHAALREALAQLPGEFSPTLNGFEDRVAGRGLALKTSGRSRTAEVSAFGRRADELILALGPALKARLATERRRPAWPIAFAWFALALATLGGPIAWRSARPRPDAPPRPAASGQPDRPSPGPG